MKAIGQWVLGIGAAAMLTASGIAACSSGNSATSGAGGMTSSVPGCAPTDPSCPAISAECLALVDYAGQSKFTLRMSQLSIRQPTVLANPLLYSVVGGALNINLPTCNVSGKGTFCWLLDFDLDQGTLRTGGALPEPDPSAGYCFEQSPAKGIVPTEIAAAVHADGSFEFGPIPYVPVPIYDDMTATTYVLMPLHAVRVFDATVSADHNCIGQFNATGLDPANNCRPDVQNGVDYFVDGAELDAYISLEEADTVDVKALGQSMCVLLSGDPITYGDGGTPIRCKRDASHKILLQGDWCSTTNTAGGCQDAFALTAGVAASAVRLRDNCPAGAGGSGGTGASGGPGGSAGAGGG